MKLKLLTYLACPVCESDLGLSSSEVENEEIITGDLECAKCAEHYPIVRGVPRFANLGEIDPRKAATADKFGFEWQHFTQKDERYAEQFLGWLDPVKPGFFKDKVVLDGGCGKGRHMLLAREWGAKEVVGVDLSDAVETAFAATRDQDNLHIIQADLCSLPLKRVVDYAYSVGVLDHTPEPSKTFRSIASKVAKGGSMSVWVYGAENNWWITHLITPVRERFTSRISPSNLLHLSKVPTAIVYLVSKLVYAPLNKFATGRAIAKRLFYNDYMQVLAGFGWMEQHNIVFDHLVSPTVTYSSREDFQRWWDGIAAEDVAIGWHNKNSWRGTGRITK